MSTDTRTWFVATSPRSPRKLANELALLKELSGRVWDRNAQEEFARRLQASEHFEGSGHERELSFSARDRINRAPKTFGLVWQDPISKVIEISKAGQRLINNERIAELWLKQLLKWQIPSPIHHQRIYSERFRIKPFLESLRLIRDVQGLTKRELAIFAVPMIDYRQYESVKSELLRFRSQLESESGSVAKKRFRASFHKKRFEAIYAHEIVESRTETRQAAGDDVAKYINTKIRNSVDYADAAIRYFRETGLFTVSRNFRIEIEPTKLDLVNNLLETVEQEPLSYFENLETYRDYFLNPELPVLPSDDTQYLKKSHQDLIGRLRKFGKLEASSSSINLEQADPAGIKTELERLEVELRTLATDKLRSDLNNNYASIDEVLGFFVKVTDRLDDEVPDKPVYFEWNTWRLFSILDRGQIENNGKLDLQGQPTMGAAGNRADIVCYYSDFILVVEVSLTGGARQYDSEGESIVRHVGLLQKDLKRSGDARPVYGLFVAPKISEPTIAHLYNTSRTHLAIYGGQVKLLPIDLDSLIRFGAGCAEKKAFEPKDLLMKLTRIFESKYSSEAAWFESALSEITS